MHTSKTKVEESHTKLEEMESFENMINTINCNYTHLPKSNVNIYQVVMKCSNYDVRVSLKTD